MDFRNLASSSKGNLYLLVSGDHRLLIECGLPWRQLQEALDFNVSGLDGCLVSHSHGDHAKSARRMVGSGVDLYASAETLEALGDAVVMESVGCHQRHHRAHALEPTVPVDVGPWQVLSFETAHDAEGSLGFLVGAPDGDLCLFATDTAYVRPLAAGCTHIAVECSWSEQLLAASDAPPEHLARLVRNHMSIERVLAMLKQTDLSKLKEIHLLHISPTHGDPEGFAAAVRAVTGKPVYVKELK